MRYWLASGLFALALFASVSAWAQVGGIGVQPRSRLPRQPGELPRPGETAFKQDTTESSDKDKKRPVRTVRRYPNAVRYGLMREDTLQLDLRRPTMWDEVDTLGGYIQSLGQVGKPYQQYRWGLSSYHLSQGLWRDPFSGEPIVYIPDASTQLPYFDSWTPYADVDFKQTAGETQLLRLDLTQNITPFWNAAFRYRRRASRGPFQGMVTDHYNLAFTTNWRSYDGRWSVMASGSFSQLRDQINGGLLGAGYVPIDSLFQATIPAVQLTGTFLARRVRSVNGLASWRVIGDSINGITVIGGGVFEESFRNWEDGNGGTAQAVSYQFLRFRPYGRLLKDSLTVVKAGYGVDRYNVFGGLRFSARIWKLLLRHQVEAEITQRNVREFSGGGSIVKATEQTLRWNALTQDTSGTKGLSLGWTLEYGRSNVQADRYLLKARAVWSGTPEAFVVKDSVSKEIRSRWRNYPIQFRGAHVPYLMGAEASVENKNPSLFQQFWTGETFAGDNGLRNETVFQARAFATLNGRLRSKRGIPYLPNYATATAFFSGQTSPLYYDYLARVRQGSGSDNVRWQGISLEGRYGLGRLYLEAAATLQKGVASSDALAPYASSQPNLYGKISLFYQYKLFRESTTQFSVGLDGHYFSEHYPLQYDPSISVWYPQRSERVPGYFRLDVYASANMFTAVAFVKVMNVLSSLNGPAYFKTAYYPMQPLWFCWGVSWQFYD